MDAPQADPSWIEYLKYVLAACVVSVSIGKPGTDPANGTFSKWLFVQSIATWFVFGGITAAAQEYFHQPFWITMFFSGTLSLVGLAAIQTAVKSGFNLFLRNKFGITDGGAGNGKP